MEITSEYIAEETKRFLDNGGVIEVGKPSPTIYSKFMVWSISDDSDKRTANTSENNIIGKLDGIEKRKRKNELNLNKSGSYV